MSEHLYRMDYLRRLQAVKDRQDQARKLITMDTPENIRVPAVKALISDNNYNGDRNEQR